MIRNAAVAGHFYKSGKTDLANEVASLAQPALPKEQLGKEPVVREPVAKKKVLGLISPHAGFIYSGSVAAAVYSHIVMPDTFILLGPNHTGLGPHFSLMAEGTWEIPTGSFEIDSEVATSIKNQSQLFKEDALAHLYEHSLEVQLPFLVHYCGAQKMPGIVPITILSASVEDCRSAAQALATTIKASSKSIVMATSSDMSHYLSDEEARYKDNLAIKKILELDPEGLYNIVRKEHITMCGYIPATVMLYAAQLLGAQKAELVKYTTSAETSGDYGRVVGYAGVLVW